MKEFRKYNNIAGWIVFTIAAVVYLLTIEPTVSWWDPGEHISTSYKLQVAHPPGAPTFQLAGRLFSLFAFGNTAKVAVMINAVSAIGSAFTILFLFWIITMLARKIIAPGEEQITPSNRWKILSAGFIGALAFTFTDSFWFSAVEANVFALSYFFTAIVFWAMLKWDESAGQKHNFRWLIFISFMIGLSIGVHLLNLLTIPALALIYYFRKFKTSRWGIVLTIGISFVILAFVMYVLIPWIPKVAGWFELFFVNSLGLPFNSGTIVYFILFIGLLVWGIIYTNKKGKTVANTLLLSVVFLLIGYTSFVDLVIRSNAGTPINEDSPKDAINLVSYLNREQYGTWPFLYGQYYNAPVIDAKDGTPVYQRDDKAGKYVIVDDRKGQIPVYDPRFTTLFPRMWSNNRKGSAEFYKNWGGPGVPIQVTDREGKAETLYKPTFGENLKYFFTYQVNWMYLRYFMWNFSGRQDDIQSFGSSLNGNWITGIPFLDQGRLGHSTTALPERCNSRASHKYFLLPLILGLIGFFYHLKREYKSNLVIIMLFLMTGLAIITFLNQQPFEPRERDYSYAGSFFAFSIWIGLGVLYLIELLTEKLKLKNNVATIIATLVAALVPFILAQQNWKDHDRSGKYSARDFSANYLNSCDKNAILFTNGDNDTFPLWYNQEVEGVRTDVRVVNLELASGSWYIDQLYRKEYKSDPLPFSMKREQYQPGTNDVVPYYDLGVKDYVDLKDLIGFIRSNSPETYANTQGGDRVKFFPAKKIRIVVDKDACIRNGIVPEYLKDQIVDTIYFTISSNQLLKNDIMMLDIIASNNWKRPICFAAPNSVHSVFGAENYCFLEGWVYKFMPVKNLNRDYMAGMGSIDPLGSYDILMHKCKWGNLNDPHVYVDPESLNNSLRPKMNFVLVAQTLVDMKEKKKASAMADEYFKYFPDPKFTLDMYDIPYAEIYYSTGDTLKANKIVSRLLDLFRQDIDYYSTFKGNSRQDVAEEMQSTVQAIAKLQYLTKDNKQDQLASKAEAILKQIQP